jgi:hypothetical protein
MAELNDAMPRPTASPFCGRYLGQHLPPRRKAELRQLMVGSGCRRLSISASIALRFTLNPCWSPYPCCFGSECGAYPARTHGRKHRPSPDAQRGHHVEPFFHCHGGFISRQARKKDVVLATSMGTTVGEVTRSRRNKLWPPKVPLA